MRPMRSFRLSSRPGRIENDSTDARDPCALSDSSSRLRPRSNQPGMRRPMNLRESSKHFDERNARAANGRCGRTPSNLWRSARHAARNTTASSTVFGIPGVHTVELYRGLAGSSIRHVTPRHEQGAGFMADGYARVTRQARRVLHHYRAGHDQHRDRDGAGLRRLDPDARDFQRQRTQPPRRRRRTLHELPSQRDVFAGLTAFSHTLLDAAELPQVLARAFAVFESARPRPVHIEIPLDVIVAPANAMKAARAGARGEARRPIPPRSLRPWTCSPMRAAR